MQEYYESAKEETKEKRKIKALCKACKHRMETVQEWGETRTGSNGHDSRRTEYEKEDSTKTISEYCIIMRIELPHNITECSKYELPFDE